MSREKWEQLVHWANEPTLPSHIWKETFNAILYADSRIRELELDLEIAIDEMYKENTRLREAVEWALDNCVMCGGTGELKDAVQAWDIPDAPIPSCSICDDIRRKAGMIITTKESNPEGDEGSRTGSK